MKYRKKPVVIEAMQLTTDNYDEVCDFIASTPANFVERALAIESVEVSSDVYADEKEFVQGISLLALAQIAKQMEEEA